MITPGFFGLFNAHRGLIATQDALNTINNNITNANTPGYSRQRVDLSAYTPYATPSLNGPNGGQLGQGPTVEQVTRSRDQFLDTQFRLSSGVLGSNTAYKSVLDQIQGIVGEPSSDGLNATIQDFFDSAQAMSLHPDQTAVLNDYIQSATDMLQVFQQQAGQLQDLRTNLVGDPNAPGTLPNSQIAIQANEVNEKLQAIVNLNQNIVAVQTSGANANDLLDQRDLLLDQLSQLADIKVDTFSNGQVNVSIAGQQMIQGNKLVDTLTVTTNTNAPPATPTPADVPAFISTTNGGVVLNDGSGAEITSGTLKGVIDMGGNDPTFSTIRSVLEKLNTLVTSITDQVNTLQTGGMNQYGVAATDPMFNLNVATPLPAGDLAIFHLQVNPAIENDPKKIATASNDPTAPGGYAGIGDGSNALNIAKLRDQTFGALGNAGFVDYLNATVSKLGIDTKSYEDAATSQANVVQNVDLQRQSVSGVNIEEEMINMLQYQHAFQATSKVISMFDDMYKTIIGLAD